MAAKKDPCAKFRKLKQHPDYDKMTPAERRLYGEYLQSDEQKFRPLDTPASPYPSLIWAWRSPPARRKPPRQNPRKSNS